MTKPVSYRWSEKAMGAAKQIVNGITADEAAMELKRIAALSGGGNLSGMSPQQIVDHSKPSDAVLHGFFEWDDTVAGRKFRCWQARQLLRSIVVVRERQAEPVRAFVSVRTGEKEPKSGNATRVFMPIENVKKTKHLADRVLCDMHADMERFISKYAVHLDYLGLREEHESLKQVRDRIIAKIEAEQNKKVSLVA